jgi:hypothetical protein
MECRSARLRRGLGSTAAPRHGCSARRSRPAIAERRKGRSFDPFEPVIRRVLEGWPEIKAPRVTEVLRAHATACTPERRARRAPERSRCGSQGALRPTRGRAPRRGSRPVGPLPQFNTERLTSRPSRIRWTNLASASGRAGSEPSACNAAFCRRRFACPVARCRGRRCR